MSQIASVGCVTCGVHVTDSLERCVDRTLLVVLPVGFMLQPE